MAVDNWIMDEWNDITGGSPVEIGQIAKHKDGRTIKIIDGQYWGEYGLSNYWQWREVLLDGTLSDNLEGGYGKELVRGSGVYTDS